MKRWRLLAVWVGGSWLVACGGPGRFIQRGMDDYSRGDYASAEARFNELETDVPDMNPKGYVRYKIYRGLTKLELGDKAQGCALLREGKSALDRGESRWLPDNIHQRVSEAMVSCGAQ